jgi:hypothetical protein
LSIYLYFLVSTGDEAFAQLALTYAMIAMGLILVIFVEPPSEFWVGGDDLAGDWRPTLLALGLFVAFFAGLQTPLLRDFYGMSALRQPSDYLVIVGVAVIWTFVLRFVWRAHLFERYLGLDLSSSIRGQLRQSRFESTAEGETEASSAPRAPRSGSISSRAVRR